MKARVTLALCIVFLAVLVGGVFARTVRITGAEVTRLEIGAPAPDFKLFGVDYRYHSIAMYPDKKAVVVAFHCNHCPISRRNRQDWVAFANKWHARDVQVLVINPNPVDKVEADSFPQMMEVARENNYPFPYLYDETQKTAAAYGARRTDDVYVLGPADDKGVRKVMYIGPLNNRNEAPHYASDALEAILAGRQVEKTEVAEFGCTIKYRTADERKARGVSFN